MTETESHVLNPDEQARLDELLKFARRAHTVAIVVAALLVAMSALDKAQSVHLPIGDVVVSPAPAAVLGYGLVVLMTGVSEWFMWNAAPFVMRDPRRPPFAWFVFSGRLPSLGPWLVGVILPVLLAALACGSLLSASAIDLKVWKVSIGSMLFGGFMFCGLPSFVVSYSKMLDERKDWHDTPLSLSVWLHFWMRLIRQVTMSVALFIPIFSVINPWRAFVHDASKLLWVCAIGVWLSCLMGLPFARRIDKRGVTLGFASTYKPDGKP